MRIRLFLTILILSLINSSSIFANHRSGITSKAEKENVETPIEIPYKENMDSSIYATQPLSDFDLRERTIFEMPYSLTRSCPDWHRLWVNTAVLSGAFVGTLLVLECLPEDATSWNRAELQDVPLFKRWHNHVIKKGPEWDHDKFYFNYILHPYAGNVYFMAARSCGFNFWQSLLYCSLVSNIGWEFGVEAFMERPSYQDLIITPLVGSAIGECSYRLKRRIVENGYQLAGSRFLGNLVVFVIDPVNEVIDLFRGSNTRALFKTKNTPFKVNTAFMPITSTGTVLNFCISF